MTQVFLGMGSNQGDRRAHLASGVALLGSDLRDIRFSRVYETEPVGVTEQPLFFNLVITGDTDLSPKALLSFVKGIERRVGRKPTFRWGPRVLDIDILLYGYESMRDSDLVIPHPQLLRRDFVLVPLCELAPDVELPDGSFPCTALANRPPGPGVRPMGSLVELA